ncbi:hypothetical protein JW859_13970 [bacterium]|nr:hypothetical protein [bacterium]
MSKDNLKLPLVITLFAVICALLLAGCGGGAVITPDTTITPETTNESGETPSGNILPLGSAIPALPTGLEDVAAEASARSTSAILDYPGSDFLVASGASTDGDMLILESSAEDPAWAMYKAEDLAGMKITKFAIETIPGSPNCEYSVGFSNYDDGYWEYYITTNLPEAEIDLSENTTHLISSLGNAYWLVIVWGGERLTILQSHLFTADDPGMPGDPGDYPFPFCGVIDSMGEGYFMLWSMDPGCDPLPRTDPGNDGFMYRIDYDDDTMWFDEYGNEAGPADFAAGDEVFVDTLVTDDGILAIMVQEMGQPDPGIPYVPLEGEIATIGDGLITLADGSACNYDDNTEWFPLEFDGTPSADDFEPGDYVLIDAVEIDGLSGLMAMFVMELPEDPNTPPGDPGRDDIWPIDGEITALGNQTLTVDWCGQAAEISWDADTIWLTEDGEGGPEDFAVGDFVHVDALETDGGWWALMVMDMGDPGEPGDPGNEPLIFIGEISQLTDSTITFFDGLVVEYDEDTLWFDELMEPITPDDVEVGDCVLVEALLDDNGTPVAVTVYLLGEPGIR